MSKTSKKKDSNHRVGSGSKNEKDGTNFTTSSGFMTSSSDGGKGKYKTYPLWPEFSDSDINAEKWEVPKTKERGKSPSTPSSQQIYEDYEGKVEMPSNMQVQCWARLPQELSASKSFVVVENEDDFDLINYSKHLCCFPLMRMIMSQITLLWNLESSKKQKVVNKERTRMSSSPELADDGRWRPWEHIYSMCKSGRGHMPLYNPTGKYVVRLYYMGCWRKIVIDDQMPYNADGQLMLPTSAHKNELWPMLLSKALVKIASVNYRQSNNSNCIGITEFSVIHALTGWLPEITPLCPINDTWELLKKLLPEWKYPADAVKEEEGVAEAEETALANNTAAATTGLQVPKGHDVKGQGSARKMQGGSHNNSIESNAASITKHDKSQKADGKKEKTKDSTRERQKSESDNFGGDSNHGTPESVVFATFDVCFPTPVPLSVVKNMADGCEVLRNMGLSQMMSHPILVKKTRSVPLVPAPVEAPVPRWKLIRPRPKHTNDQSEKKPTKPDMWLEVSSPFLSMPKPKTTDPKSNPMAGLDEFDEQEQDSSEDVESFSATNDEADNTAGSETSPTEPAKPAAPTAVTTTATGLKPAKAVDAKDSRKLTGGAADRLEVLGATGRRGTTTDNNHSTTSIHGPASSNKKNSSSVANNNDSKKTDKSDRNNSDGIPTGNLHINEYNMPSDADFIKSVWIDFDDFCKTFRNIIIFHKPYTYRHNSSSCEFKPTVSSGQLGGSGLPPPAAPSAGSSKKNSLQPSSTNLHTKHASPSALFTHLDVNQLDKPIEESQMYNFLVVDSIHPSEIIICLSSLVYWPGIDLKQLSQRDSLVGDSTLDVHGRETTSSSGRTKSTVVTKHPQFKGHLVIEPYSWIDGQIYQPISNVKTNGVYATCLILPPGRNVLRFNVSWNYGFNVHVSSTTPFTYGDEDVVLQPLKEESERFKVLARDVMVKLNNMVASVGHADQWKQAKRALRECYNKQVNNQNQQEKEFHNEAFLAGLYALIEKLLLDQKPHEIRHLFYVLTLDFGYVHAKKEIKRKNSSGTVQADATDQPFKSETEYDQEHWVANLILQKHARGHLVRKTMSDHRKPPNARDHGPMSIFRTTIKTNPVLHGSYLLRQMLKYEPSLITKYDFAEDEDKKVCYSEYSGEYTEQPANHWFVVFRGVFYAEDDYESRCVPKLYGLSNKCLLHVADNDTGEEVRRVFNRPVAHLYTKNQNGYTFAAEMRTSNDPMTAGKWKMKLMSSEHPQLQPLNNQIDSNFATRELRGYYVPNSNQVIFRYVVQCKVSQTTSIQIDTSCKQVQFLFEIINKGKVIASRQAKGHLFVPYCYFVGKTTPKVEAEVSPKDNPGGKSKGGKGGKSAARAHSPKEEAQKKKEKQPSVKEDDEELENRLYYIQLTLVNHSWKLTDEQLAYVEKLREVEREEMRLESNSGGTQINDGGISKEDSVDEKQQERSQRSNSIQKTKSKAKRGGKDSVEESSMKIISSSNEINFDTSQAHWTMRVVCDQDRFDDIDIRKDQSRIREIKAMKQAWEAMDEGRASRAKQSREKYLALHRPQSAASKKEKPLLESDKENDLVMTIAENEGGEEDDKINVQGSFKEDATLPPTPVQTPAPAPVQRQPHNKGEPDTIVGVVCPFTKVAKRRDSTFYDVKELNDIELERHERLDEKERQRQEKCDAVMEENLRQRTALKEQLMEECQQLQLQTDLYRTRLFKPRNQYRQALLADAKFEQEKREAQLATESAKSDQKSNKSGKSGKSSKKSKK